jgi:hypothetical protein
MITYQYRDEDGNVFEMQQSMKDDALTVSPHTNLPCKRIITGGKAVLMDRTMNGVADMMARRRAKALGENPLHTSLDTYTNQFSKG